MANDPLSAGMFLLSTAQAYQQRKGGEDAQETYNALAAEEYAQAEWEKRMGMEEMRDLDREGRGAEGRVIAQAGKGLRVAGSVKDQAGKVRTEVARRKHMISMRMQESIRRRHVRADQLRSAGRAARVAGQRQAVTSLLVGTAAVGMRRYKKGYWPFGKKGPVGERGTGTWQGRVPGIIEERDRR